MPSSHHSTTSIIFPIHNEAEFLHAQLTKFWSQLQRLKIRPHQVILVENGSRDSSLSALKKWRTNLPSDWSRKVKILSLPIGSYGQAIKHGLLAATGRQIVIFNLDFFDLRFLQRATSLLKSIDIVIGSKTLAQSQDQRIWYRRLGTYFFNVGLRLILNYPGSDTHGIKAFRNTPLLKRTARLCLTRNELFDTELVVRLHKQGALLVELPVKVRELRPTRYSTFKRFSSTMVDLFKALRVKYGPASFKPAVTTADDFGLSPTVNAAIVTTVNQKIVQVVSILPNLITKSAFKKISNRKAPQWSLHFNIVRGQPISPPQTIQSLVTKQGYFYPTVVLWLRLLLGWIDTTDIERELLAQWRKLRQLGIKVTQIDSEQHIHTFPGIWPLMVRFCLQHKVPYLRSCESTWAYLHYKPLRWLMYLLIVTSLKLRFGHNRAAEQARHSYIVHPGTNYDPAPVWSDLLSRKT